MNLPKKIPFAKLSATGNDFILFDNRQGLFTGSEQHFFQAICQRRTGIGANGILLIENSRSADFRMRYFNADGRVSEMCGNGARAAAFYACHNRIAGDHMRFEVEGVIYDAQVQAHAVALLMHWPANFRPSPGVLDHDGLVEGGYAEVGVPHYVLLTESHALDELDVPALGRYYREHSAFAPRGTNVNFMQIAAPGSLRVRTYERGVEAETLACGTGALACAFVAHKRFGQKFPIRLETRGGALEIGLAPNAGRPVLKGEVRQPFEGVLHRDAFAAREAGCRRSCAG